MTLKDKFFERVCVNCKAYTTCSQSPGNITQCATLIIWNRQL